MTELRHVGVREPRIDGRDKVSGAAQFVDDLEFGPDLLHAAVVESSHAHARIVAIDTSRAESMPGVVKVVTGRDFPFTFGLYMKDRYVFAQDKVRFVGEQVAAVVARDPVAAIRAARAVDVSYEELPAVLDPEQALADDATLLHPQLG
ncbi:MAG TPA: xanthine dehydrogenase family protein molybdopterin-binding subunit, partial [Acidimicrobiia bacterium]